MILLLHGLWDRPNSLARLRQRLAERGHDNIVSPALPLSGFRSIEEAAAVLQTAVDKQHEPIDLVAFSMGSLVARYYIMRQRGHQQVRTFVSIAGPHHGTWAARLAPGRGVAQMRTGSDLLADLAMDEGQWHGVRVHTLWTPFDLSVIPGRSGTLKGSTSERKFYLPSHRLMLHSDSVACHISQCLRSSQLVPMAEASRASLRSLVHEQDARRTDSISD